MVGSTLGLAFVRLSGTELRSADFRYPTTGGTTPAASITLRMASPVSGLA